MSDVRYHVFQALRMMSKMGDIIRDTHGNVSAVDRAAGVMYIKPSGFPYEHVDVNDIVPIDIETGQINREIYSSGLKPSVDTPNHLEIYRNNPDIDAICHTHSPYATAYAAACEPIRCVCTEHADFFGDDIYCEPYEGLDWGGKLVVPASRAVLLMKHGTLTFGSGPEKAVNLAVALENVAQKTYLATNIVGSTPCVPRLPDEQRVPWHTRFNGGGYGQ